MATNDNEPVWKTSFEEINKKNGVSNEEILRRAKESSFGWFESVYGAVQALNTADDLLLKKSEASSNRQTFSPSPAKKELAVYKTLSEKEWQQYFGLIDTTQLSQEQSKRLRTYLKDNAEKEPYLRRLVRETIQHGKPITISSTPEDWEALKKSNAAGDARYSTRHIRLLPEAIASSTVFHEILHIGQDDDNVDKENNDSYSRELIQKQRKFVEAEAKSINYLCHDKGSPDFFNKLLIKNENELRKNQQDIPAGLTDEEKELFIHTQAVNRTIGASIHILMQPKGKKTQEAAAAYGIKLTHIDLYFVNDWKEYYNNFHKEWMCKDYASQKNPYAFTNDKDREQFVHNYITNRYPGLKGKDFFVTGLTNAEQKSWDIRYRGHNYGKLTDEQIEATHLFVIDGVVTYRFSDGAKQENKWRPILRLNDIPLTEEEMNYLAKIREIQAGKRDKTDIDMPVSLKKLIETQEKTLQYNSKDKEVAAFNELVASREELLKNKNKNKNQQSHQTAVLNFLRVTNPEAYKRKFGKDKGVAAVENKNQQPDLISTLNANALKYPENDNTSSNTLPGKER